MQNKDQPTITQTITQGLAIAHKNLQNHLSNKKRLLGELVMPGIICAVYAGVEETKKDNIVVSMLLGMLLKMYLGLMASSPVREVVTLFITERTEHFRQYQGIVGVSHRTHTLSNLLYLCAFMSFFLLPLFLCILYYHPALFLASVFKFGAFVLSTCALALALTSFFKDHKIALEVIGLAFSLAAFLPFAYDPKGGSSWLNWTVMAMPNSAFSVAVLEDTITPSLVSVALVKVYLIIYSVAEFPQYYMGLFRNCCQKVSRYLPFDRQPTHLMEEFQLNEVVNSDIIPPPSRMQQVIAVRTQALTKSYQVKDSKVNALNGVSLTIHQSQIFGLLGRNGAGKTTLVDILTGVTRQTQGSFHLASPKIGICYQHEVLYQELTVDQHLQFYAKIKVFTLPQGETLQDHIEQTIRTLGIEGERGKRVKELSGGNKRKLSIAIAILGRPGLLIFDQPTSGLDPLSRINVWEIFSSLRRTRSTIILTTHHLDQAERLTDWICVIEKGAVIVENTAAQIKEKYGKGFHLEVCLKEGQTTYPLVEKYRHIVEKAGLKAVDLEHLPSQANLLVKPASKDSGTIEFQKAFAEVVAELQRDDTVEARFHSNTLEQSFIAILRDEENSSGDSLSEQPLPRDSHSHPVSYRWLRQVFGITLRNLLYQKSIFTQAIIIYNINILIVLISSLFNSLFQDVLPSQAKKPSGPNPMMLLQGYAVMATAFITLPVYEREKKIKGVLSARGVGWAPYWLGSFIFDYSAYWINLAILGHLVAKAEVERLGWGSLGLLGIGVILYAYCASNLFSKLKTASIWFPVINMLMSILLLPMLLLSNGKFSFFISILKVVYPYFDLTVSAMTAQMGEKEMQMMELFGISIGTSNGYSIYLCIGFYFTLLLLIELKPVQRIRSCVNGGTDDRNTQQKIRLQHVYKKFGDVQALQDVTYFASQERLALLGHNGAGKSTTFGLLSAQLTADQGEVYLQGTMRVPWQSRLRSAGICYQQDALWQGMLVQDVLRIASWVSPVGNSEREEKWLTESLEFDPTNAFKRVSNLSGGNKRKLCMMFALFGDPALRLLDECSTGLDPASRLAMVDTLKSSSTGTTVFTTHSMSEAEDLCTKAVIMSKGRVLEFDLIGKMRTRHFDCFWVQVELQEQAWSGLASELQRQGVTVGGEGHLMRLQVDKKSVKKSDLLKMMIALKQRKSILNFSWIQPRLEDVYLKVTRQNGDEPLVSDIDTGAEVI